VSITHIFETPIHVDFFSAACELCARAESSKIFLSHEGGARYGFDREKIVDGSLPCQARLNTLVTVSGTRRKWLSCCHKGYNQLDKKINLDSCGKPWPRASTTGGGGSTISGKMNR
jgi:hypothetical protein